jgi:predicted RNase H-like nuclease (RuvC/YqgF family)
VRHLDKCATRHGETSAKLERLRAKVRQRDEEIARLKRDLKHKRKNLTVLEVWTDKGCYF